MKTAAGAGRAVVGAQEILASLPKHIKVVDLSADFRLRNVDTYAEWCAPRAEAPLASQSGRG